MSRRIERLPLNDGLPHNLTYALLQDSQGFIWIGTMHGLAKYDGRNFQMFRHNAKDKTSISFDDIISLLKTVRVLFGSVRGAAD
jgi:ligand-binding sensor domain-containing protein